MTVRTTIHIPDHPDFAHYDDFEHTTVGTEHPTSKQASGLAKFACQVWTLAHPERTARVAAGGVYCSVDLLDEDGNEIPDPSLAAEATP